MKLQRILPAVAIASVAMSAQAYDLPSVYTTNFSNKPWLERMSDNGQYAIFQGLPDDGDAQYNSGSILVDMGTKKVTSLHPKDITYVSAFDVSDDGKTVVGSVSTTYYGQLAAVWDGEDWDTLPLPAGGWQGSLVANVTPDGALGVGYAYSYNSAENYGEEPVLWDLKKKEIIETPGLIRYCGDFTKSHQIRFTKISQDGNYIIGVIDFSYLNTLLTFVYDRAQEKCTVLGLNMDEENKTVTRPEGLEQLYRTTEDAFFSPNGRYIAGDAYIVEEFGVLGGAEYYAPYVYDMQTGEYILYTDTEAINSKVGAVTDEGVLYIASPYESPIRQWSVRSGNYWVSGDQILSQVFGTTIEKFTGYSDVTTGTVIDISNDGKTIGAMIMATTGENYITTFPERPEVLAAGLNLLDTYTVTPVRNSELSQMRNVKLVFDRDIQIQGEYNGVKLMDGEGNLVKESMATEVKADDSKCLEVTFRAADLQDGEVYKVVIPAGYLCIKGDESRPNAEISILYRGRAKTPVAMTKAAPASGSMMAAFDASGNTIDITFDTNIKASDNPQGSFEVIGEDGTRQYLSSIGMTVSGNTARIYPASAQTLYKGLNYAVRIEAGTFTDIQGDNPSETIELTYVGSYEKTFDPDQKYVLKIDFNGSAYLSEIMLAELDGNTPTAEMQSWGFVSSEGVSYPWIPAFDNDDLVNGCFASHSMYEPAGKSEDWFAIQQVTIPDENCALVFKAQSYLPSKKDVLKVFVVEDNKHYNLLDGELLQKFQNATPIFEQQLVAGGGTLAGNWKEYAVSLKDYAGKNVYIGFLNDNEDQSAVFVDDVCVERQLDFFIVYDNDQRVVARDNIDIYGRLSLESADAKVTSAKFTLLDKDGNEVDTCDVEGDYAYGDQIPFSFTKPLALRKGVTNEFTVKVEAGALSGVFSSTVDNLAFAPTQRVVVEEGTGQGCSNCPMGHRTLELLHEAYGDKVIPAAYHTYDGDALHSNLRGYVQGFLGISGYPAAVVNRMSTETGSFKISAPMVTKDKSYIYNDPSVEGLWWNDVTAAFAEGTIADIEFEDWKNTINTPVYMEDGKTIAIPVKVTYAIEAKGINHYIQALILEDGLVGFQSNGHYTATDPVLGEWANGGIYAKQMVAPFTFDHVARYLVGSTYNGEPNLIPTEVTHSSGIKHTFRLDIPETVSNIENCGVVIMLIDANTGKMINANYAKFTSGASVEEMVEEVVSKSAKVYADGSDIVVEASGEVAVQLYGANGQLLNSVVSDGSVRLGTNGYKGVVIVRTMTEGQAGAAKVMVK